MRLPRGPASSCSACLFVVTGLFVAGLALLIILCQFALTLFSTTIKGAFDLVRDSFLGIVGLLGTLPNWAVMPVAGLMLVGVLWVLKRWWEAQRWRDLDVIREEYEPLVKLLRRRGLRIYLGQIETIRDKILLERDKIEELGQLLEEELPKIEARISDLSNQLGRPGEEQEKTEIRTLMRELIGNSSRLRGRKADLERFQKSKVRLASKLNCLRLKLIQEPKEETSIGAIMQAINSISLIEDIWTKDGRLEPETTFRQGVREPSGEDVAARDAPPPPLADSRRTPE